MTEIVETVLRWSTGRRVLQALLLMGLGGGALFQLGPYPTLKSEAGGAPLPEETVMSPAAFRSFLSDLGESGRALYSSFQIWDLLNPLLIGFLGVALIGWLVGNSGLVPGRRLVIIVPFVAPLADLGENILILLAIAAFPDVTRLASLLPVVTIMKFVGLAGTVFLGLVLTVLAIRHSRKARRAAAT